MDIVLFGIQGSGKGTQARTLIERFSFAYFETGGALRTLAKESSPLGQKVKSIIEAGHLVPNEVVMEIIEDFMEKLQPGVNILFDGIPRQMQQAKSFDALMQKHNRQFRCLLLELSRDKAEERLLKRRMCTACKTIYPAAYTASTCACGGKLIVRKDDNESSIMTRLDVFEKETIPVIDNYKQRGLLIAVNGDQQIEDVTKEMLIKLNL